VSVCLLVTTVSSAEAAERIEMPLGVQTRVGPWKHVLDACPDPASRDTLGSTYSVLKIRSDVTARYQYCSHLLCRLLLEENFIRCDAETAISERLARKLSVCPAVCPSVCLSVCILLSLCVSLSSVYGLLLSIRFSSWSQCIASATNPLSLSPSEPPHSAHTATYRPAMALKRYAHASSRHVQWPYGHSDR